MLSWMKRTRSSSFASSSTIEAWEIPIDASRVRDLTMSGKPSRRGLRTARPRGTATKSGTATRWKARIFLARALSRARSSPRVLQPV